MLATRKNGKKKKLEMPILIGFISGETKNLVNPNKILSNDFIKIII